MSLALVLLSLAPQLIAPSGGRSTVGSGPAPIPASRARPDVLVVLFDDVGAIDVEQLSAQGKVPALDGLAAQGTRFRRFHGQPQCSYARVTLLLSTWTGEDPSGGWGGFACEDPQAGGEIDEGPDDQTIPHDLDALAKPLAGAGYSTGYVGRWGLGTNELADAGQTEYTWTPGLWGFEHWGALSPDGIAACVPSPAVASYSNWWRVDGDETSISTEYNTDAIVAEAQAAWLSMPSPKLLVVATNDAHEGGPLDAWGVPPPSALRPGTAIPANPGPRQRYLLKVQACDYALERVLSVVSLRDTLVVVAADNGTPREVRPLSYGFGQVKFSVFEGGVRVPGIVAGLGFPAGIISDQPVSLADVAPTLADVAGVVPPTAFRGQSIVPALWSEQLGRDWTYVQNDSDRAATARRAWGGTFGSALRTLKLLEVAGQPQVLYDLDADPGEDSPIPATTPGMEDVVAALRVIMAQAVR